MKTTDFHFVLIPTLRRDNSGIEPCQVGIPILPDKVRIPTLSRTILELSRFLLCAEHKRMNSAIYDVMKSYLTRVRDKNIRNGYITLESKVCYVIKADLVQYFGCQRLFRFLGFYAVSTVFQLFNGDSSQIHVSWTIFKQHLASPLS